MPTPFLKATACQLASLLTPFIGARPHLARNAAGSVTPRDTFADIAVPGVRFVDADIRAADGHGIEVVTLGGATAIQLAWSEISEVVIRNENGGTATYRPVAEMAVAA